MPLGTELGLGPGDIVLDGGPAPPKGHTPPNFRPMSIVAERSSISATAEHFYFLKISANDLQKSEIICTNSIFCRDQEINVIYLKLSYKYMKLRYRYL